METFGGSSLVNDSHIIIFVIIVIIILKLDRVQRSKPYNFPGLFVCFVFNSTVLINEESKILHW